ncbi:RNA-directed DNA polymerase, eukaryota, reverse transcriptase zinc-binding domain protein [Tanacetum coccineum]
MIRSVGLSVWIFFMRLVWAKKGVGGDPCTITSSMASILVMVAQRRVPFLLMGRKQGDPLAPYLFILIMESLHISFSRVVDDGLFKGFQLHGSVNISHLFYADDAMFIGEWSEQTVHNILRSLIASIMRRSQITLLRAKSLGVGVSQNVVACRRRIGSGCVVLNTPFRLSCCDGWGSVMSRRLTLLKSVLGASPIYYMSIFKVPKGVLKTMESIRSKFFNGVDSSDRKISWVAWDNVLASKLNGGLGVSSFFAFPVCLLSNWIKEIVVANKMGAYFGFQLLFAGTCVMELERLYALEVKKTVDVASKLSQENLTWSFRRPPRSGVEQDQLTDLTTYVEGVVLGVTPDRFSEVSTQTRWIKAVSIKVNIHAWKVRMDCLPTRLNISLRGIDIPSILCHVCGSVTKSSSRLFFDCLVAKDNFRKICRWWEVDFMEVHTFDEWVSWIVNLRIPIKHKRVNEHTINLRDGTYGLRFM